MLQLQERPRVAEEPAGNLAARLAGVRAAIRRPRKTAVVVVLGFVVQLAFRLWLARGVDAPAGHPDEDGYLIAARVLTGGPGGYSTENVDFRRVGYPLLLTPAYWWPGDAFDVFHRAQVISAFFGASVFPLAALFARRVLAVPTRWALGMGFAAAALPAVTFYSTLAMTDAVLPALFLGWAILAHGWLAAKDRGSPAAQKEKKAEDRGSPARTAEDSGSPAANEDPAAQKAEQAEGRGSPARTAEDRDLPAAKENPAAKEDRAAKEAAKEDPAARANTVGAHAVASGALTAEEPTTRAATGWAYAVASGALAGFIYTVHVRGTMVLAAHLLLVLVAVLARRVKAGPVVGTLAASAALQSVNGLLLDRIGDRVHLLGVSPESQLDTALTVDWGVVTVVTRFVGQFWAMGVGTLGIGLLGILAAVVGIARPRDPRALTLLAVLVATGLIAMGSAVSLPFTDHRLTYFAYPRYLHFLYPVWLLVGMSALKTARKAGVAVAAFMVFSAVVVGMHIADLPPTPFVAFDAVESTLLSWQWSRLDLVVPTIVAIALCGLAIAAAARPRTAAAALVALALLGGFQAEVTRERVTMPMVDPQYLADTPRLVRDLKLGPGDTVAEAWQVRFPDLFNHMREVDWEPIVFFDANVPPPPQATVVIAPWDPYGRGPSWNGASWGMSFVAGAPRQGWAVWRRNA